MRVKFLLPLLFLSSLAWAETRTYLVKRTEHFPQDRYLYEISPQEFKKFVDTGKKTMVDANGQPFRLTAYTINYSGKYAMWSVSFKDEDEKWHIDSMEKQGYIILLSSMDVVTVNYGPKGDVIEVRQSILSETPTDYYYVGTSTP